MGTTAHSIEIPGWSLDYWSRSGDAASAIGTRRWRAVGIVEVGHLWVVLELFTEGAYDLRSRFLDIEICEERPRSRRALQHSSSCWTH